MQHLGSLAAFRHSARGSFFRRLAVEDHVPRRSFARSIKSSKLAVSGGHGGSVAMEVVAAWNDAVQLSLSDLVFRESGMRCVMSSAPVLCNVNDTVEDALRTISTMDGKLRSMWEEKKILSSSIVTANVYHHYAKFTHICGANIIVVDVVHPKHDAIMLHLHTKLWRAKELMNERRSLLEKEARKTRNVFGEYTEVIWRGGSCSSNSKNFTLSHLQGTQENRLWLEIRYH